MTGFVKTNGTKFHLNGHDFRFVGANLRGLVHYGDADLLYGASDWDRDATLQLDAAKSMGAKVVRVFGANRHVKTDDVKNRLKCLIDKINREGRDIYVIFSFTDVHSDTGFNVRGDERFYQDRLDSSWYEGGYKQNYWPFVKEIVERFKDEPRIFAWELGNELKAYNKNHILPKLFINFAKDVSKRIREIDGNHLITTGAINCGNLAVSSQELYGPLDLDFMTCHVYYDLNPSDDKLEEIKRANHEAQSAKNLNMPFIIEEIGIEGRDRANRTKQKLAYWFDQKGAAGVMQWGVMATGRDIADGDKRYGVDNVFPNHKGDYKAIVDAYKEQGTAIK